MQTILLSAYACLPNRGSEEGNGWHYATLLSQRGLQTHCITREEFRSEIEPVLAEGNYPNLTVHYVAVPGWLDRAYGNLLGMYAHYLYWQWQASKLAKKLDRRLNFDLVHHVTYSSLQLGSFMYRVGKPFIFGPVGGGQRVPKVMKQYLGGYYSRELMRDGVSWLFERLNPGFYRTMKKADLVLISNADTLKLAQKYRIGKPMQRVMDSGIGEEFLALRPHERPANPAVLNLLWVGRLLPRKALELTIHAFSQVDPTLPIRLTIVGGQGQMADQVPTYLSKYNVADRVQWVGHVSYDEVRAYYQQSDVFFFTSLRDSCPTQLVEAMAYSLPVVTLAIHGQAELVNGKNGIKVPVNSPEQVVADLARAIERLYHNPAERLEMGRNAYAFSKSQVWDEKISVFTDRLYPALVANEKLVSTEQ
ncbi:glycosyltransferase family 4 protein [Fibrella sp. ES10-3-2-2]|nr:glycosyl transferase family 1 [Fibrella sp. ES10-3-2-2]